MGELIRPALQAGRVVLSDRYDLSTLAYQAAGRGLPLPMVTWVNTAATGGLRPDLTLILDVPSEVGTARQLAAGKSRDRIDREPLEFHQRVAARYREERGAGIVHLGATLPPAELASQAWAAMRWALLPVVLLALAGLIWLTRRAPVKAGPGLPAATKLFQDVFAKVKSSAVDALDEQEIYRRAAAGVIDELDDPYAMLQLPGEHPVPTDDTPVGPGLYLDRRDGLVVIVATVPGSLADSAGVRAGDRLLGVDSVPADPSRLDKVVAQLEGRREPA